jgi:hypothetical protein
VISGFRRNVDDICALLGYYAILSGSSVPTFRDNLSISPIFKGQEIQEPLNMGLIACPETSVQNYDSTLRNIPEERRSQSL